MANTRRFHSPRIQRDELSSTLVDREMEDWRGSRPTAKTSLLFASGTRIYQYELIRPLGEGGMGTIYLARDLKLGRRVAIKFLHSSESDLTQRFLFEARATAQCTHENIVVIHDVNDHRGIPFMVLEYLDGHPLSDLLRGEPLPASRAVELMVPVVRALACAHRHKIVHRDLKPDNIYVTSSGTIKVLDFGIAKFIYGDKQADLAEKMSATRDLSNPLITELTDKGALLGTMPYMSPEQWGTDEVDHRTDIWAAGIILYRMMNGRHPLSPLTYNRLASIALLDEPIPSLGDGGVEVPDQLIAIVDGCLKKSKHERIASAEQLLEALVPHLPRRRVGQAIAGESPYAGLAAFQEADADRFFGRSRDIAAVLNQLRFRPLVAVVGPSGIGKSSFVRAGLIPALKRSGQPWDAVIIRPGRTPLASLANALASYVTGASETVAEELSAEEALKQQLASEPGYLGALLRSRARREGRKIALYVDQFEELYALASNPQERGAFLASLLGMADDDTAPLRVILSVRSDFLDEAARDRDFMTELSRGFYFLPPPDRPGLREALIQPAEMAGYQFEDVEVVEHMLDDLETTHGALPLLQFTACLLWDNRDKKQRQLTAESYHRLGGVAGALASHADRVLASRSKSAQELTRLLFQRLVTSERTRDIVELRDLRGLSSDPHQVDSLIDYLVEARLLVVHRGSDADEPQVELIHESLIERWPTLRQWLDEDREMVEFLSHLRTAARQWRGQGKSEGMLWRDNAVERARRWRDKCRDQLAESEREYLDAVFALDERWTRRKRRLIAGAFALLVILVAAAAVALVVIRNAEKQALAAYTELKQEQEAKRQLIDEKSRLDELANLNREQLVEKTKESEEAKERAETEAERARMEAEQAEQSRNEAESARRDSEQALAAAVAARKAEKKAREAAETALEEARQLREAAEAARREAEQAKQRLQELLKNERARVERLERELGRGITRSTNNTEQTK
ncbi:MAG: protein kinase [Proteobacteria bacterium]|nr:protein kinase [Pseudomonadota bacterium]